MWDDAVMGHKGVPLCRLCGPTCTWPRRGPLLKLRCARCGGRLLGLSRRPVFIGSSLLRRRRPRKGALVMAEQSTKDLAARLSFMLNAAIRTINRAAEL